MGLEEALGEIVSSVDSVDEPEIDPEDVGTSREDWKFAIAHCPEFAARVAYNGGEEEAKMMVDLIDDVLKNGHSEFRVNSKMEEHMETARESIVEKL